MAKRAREITSFFDKRFNETVETTDSEEDADEFDDSVS